MCRVAVRSAHQQECAAANGETAHIIADILVCISSIEKQGAIVDHQTGQAVAAGVWSQRAVELQGSRAVLHQDVVVLRRRSGDVSRENQLGVGIAHAEHICAGDGEAAVGNGAGAVVFQCSTIEDEVGGKVAGGSKGAGGAGKSQLARRSRVLNRVGKHDLRAAENGADGGASRNARPCNPLPNGQA